MQLPVGRFFNTSSEPRKVPISLIALTQANGNYKRTCLKVRKLSNDSNNLLLPVACCFELATKCWLGN
jgi:hypothetical protein